MVFAGMLPWNFFSTGLSEASNSLINNANLISKVYFPRLIVPTATVVVAFVDLLISFLILVLLMAWYRFLPDWRVAALPAFIAFGFFASIGPSARAWAKAEVMMQPKTRVSSSRAPTGARIETKEMSSLELARRIAFILSAAEAEGNRANVANKDS